MNTLSIYFYFIPPRINSPLTSSIFIHVYVCNLLIASLTTVFLIPDRLQRPHKDLPNKSALTKLNIIVSTQSPGVYVTKRQNKNRLFDNTFFLIHKIKAAQNNPLN